MTIRDARREDLDAIVAIYNAAIPARMSTADLEPVTVAAREPWFAGHTPGRRPLWVLERDGVVLGWLSLTDWHTRAAYAATAQVGVYVSPDARRSGVGRRLLSAACSRAPSLGIDRMLGLVFAHNTPSLGLFTSLDFERWGLLPGVTVLDGQRRDVAIMGRAW